MQECTSDETLIDAVKQIAELNAWNLVITGEQTDYLAIAITPPDGELQSSCDQNPSPLEAFADLLNSQPPDETLRSIGKARKLLLVPQESPLFAAWYALNRRSAKFHAINASIMAVFFAVRLSG